MSRKKSIYTLASVYIGTVIGAGFASGQEILQFFGRHGHRGILGLVGATILFSLMGALVLNMVYSKKIRSFQQFIRIYFAEAFFNIINGGLIFLLFIIYVVMLSGSGAVVYEHFRVPSIYGIIIMALASLYVFIFGVEGVARANNIVVPLLILVIFLVGMANIYKNKIVFSSLYNYPVENIRLTAGPIYRFLARYLARFSWLWSGLIYVAFNMVSSVAIMASLGPLIKDKRAGVLGGLLGGILLGILALVILINLLISYTDIMGRQVPMLVIASNLGMIWKGAYSLILLIAMFTTAIANGYGFISGIHNLTGRNPGLISIVTCLVSIPLATLGFKNLVGFFYPFFGYIGMVFIGLIVYKNIGLGHRRVEEDPGLKK